MNEFVRILPYVAGAACAALLGALLAARWQPTRNWRSYIQHCAAGLAIAAVSVEMLPDIERLPSNGFVLVGSFTREVRSVLDPG